MHGLVKHLILAIKSKILLLINIHRYRISIYAKSHYSAVYSFVRHRAHDRQTIKELTDPVCSTPWGSKLFSYLVSSESFHTIPTDLLGNYWYGGKALERNYNGFV
jgi:hypothetical protein